MLHSVAPVLEVRNLHARRGGMPVVRDLTLRVFAGTVAAIVGPAGAGKSTALQAIAGLIPARGSVTFEKRRMQRMSAHRIVRWGMVHVSQDRGAIPDLTVRENLEIGAWTRRDRYAVRNEIAALFDRFPDLGRRASSKGCDLSSAEQRLLAFARALMAKPRLIIVDEPSAGLPPERVAEIFAIIAQLSGQGIPMLLAEQYERKALALSDYVYVMEQGRIVKEGVARHMLAEPEIASAHFGDP
jgi:branched-chain amino acid transport system ATP-binding protein